MSRKNHIARIMTVMLLISVMVSMAGVEGSFEIKINTVQHSSSLNGEMSASNSPPVNTSPATPVPTLTIQAASTPAVSPTDLPTPLETVSPLDNGNVINTPETGQDNFLALISSMFDSSSVGPGPDGLPTPVPTIVPTMIATTVPTPVPTIVPTTIATTVPTPVPTIVPTMIATTVPTPVPTRVPTTIVTTVPTPVPTRVPTTIVTTVPTQVPEPNKDSRGNGTISMITTNGSFFGIVSDEGSLYVPDKIDPLFQVDGLRVTYHVLERRDREETHNWGIPVDLLELMQVGRVIEQRIDGNGTIHYEDLEGGFYGIIADSGSQYLPTNLNATFRVDGRRVNFSAYPASVSTISMWGTPVRLITIVATGEPDLPLIVMTGHIRWISGSQDGGRYGIFGDDGTRYIPVELDRSYKHNGLYVTFTAEEVRTDTMISLKRVVPVRLIDIALIEK